MLLCLKEEMTVLLGTNLLRHGSGKFRVALRGASKLALMFQSVRVDSWRQKLLTSSELFVGLLEIAPADATRFMP